MDADCPARKYYDAVRIKARLATDFIIQSDPVE